MFLARAPTRRPHRLVSYSGSAGTPHVAWITPSPSPQRPYPLSQLVSHRLHLQHLHRREDLQECGLLFDEQIGLLASQFSHAGEQLERFDIVFATLEHERLDPSPSGLLGPLEFTATSFEA